MLTQKGQEGKCTHQKNAADATPAASLGKVHDLGGFEECCNRRIQLDRRDFIQENKVKHYFWKRTSIEAE